MELVPPRWRELGGSGALIVDHYDIRRGTNFLNLGTPHKCGRVRIKASQRCAAVVTVYTLHIWRPIR